MAENATQHCHRLAETQPARPILAHPPPAGTEKQSTAPADHPVRESAHADAFTTDAAICGAGSVHRRTGMQTARALPGDSGRRGSPPATDCRQNPPPPSPVNQTRCFTEHGRRLHDRARTTPHLTPIPHPRNPVSVTHLAGTLLPHKRRCKMILMEPWARAV